MAVQCVALLQRLADCACCAVHELANTFQPFGARQFHELVQSGLWGANGPKLLTRVIKNYAAKDVNILPTNSFFMVPPSEILDNFKVFSYYTSLVFEEYMGRLVLWGCLIENSSE